MNGIKTFLCVLTYLVTTNFCYAAGANCADKYENDLYPPLFQDGKFAVHFKIAKTSADPNSEVFPIEMVGQQCDTGAKNIIAELPYLGDTGKVESAFLADSDFDGNAELFVIHRVTLYSDTGINYSSDYFTTLVYKRLAPLKYELNERISTYFGSGGDVFSGSSNGSLIYDYPYKSEASIKKQLISTQYKAWFERKTISTRTLAKTYLHSHANTSDITSSYLIAGDQIRVLDQNAGWLEILFHNKKKGDIKGWILCKDTLECTESH